MGREQHVLFINSEDTYRHKSSANASLYPNLGLLTLMSALRQNLGDDNRVSLGYLDGVIHGNKVIEDFIDDHSGEIAAVCFSVLTVNYGASVTLAKRVKSLNPDTVTIFGNDHFSALYQECMQRQPVIDFGFYGNDVVTGFSDFVSDQIHQQTQDYSQYPGLVYRTGDGQVRKNPENPGEYGTLPFVDYRLADGILDHQRRYLDAQKGTYFFIRDRQIASQVTDIGRGCIKFAGLRQDNIPVNACDFCGIIPGVNGIASPDAGRAWSTLKNVFDQGYNYFYITADELPLTLWPLLRGMAANQPEWYKSLPEDVKPKMFGYARAESFAYTPERIDLLVKQLGFNHFFIGFDGLSEISLRLMNKQPVGKRAKTPLMAQNFRALDKMVDSQGLVTAGIVLTHLGITPEIMQENYETLAAMVSEHPRTFAALDFGPLCPIPGSQSFKYLTHPDHAQARADKFHLRIDRDYLEANKGKYIGTDDFNMGEVVADFIKGCCPEISQVTLDEYSGRLATLCNKYGIVIGGGV